MELTFRPRRLRGSAAIRDMVSDVEVRARDLIAPIFVAEGRTGAVEIPSLPGVFQFHLDGVIEAAERLLELGVRAVILFGIPEHKTPDGRGAWDPTGIVQLATQDLVRRFGQELVVINDLCLDEYTDHGHCGVLGATGEVDNDATVELYCRAALAQANAGAHMVAPSGMMDGQVGAIRCALDSEGFENVSIMAYSAKYASALYGPFRDAVQVQIRDGGDRRTYQQDPKRTRESRLEAMSDVEQGADIVMVKPAISYLDVIADLRSLLDVPIAAYQVSGEYAMAMAAGDRGWIDAEAVLMEQLISIRRAGADLILSYFSGRCAEILASAKG